MKKIFTLVFSLLCIHCAFAQADDQKSPLLVIAIATPETIELGESVTLQANVLGGTGNYTYEWTPAETISDPAAAVTTATPIVAVDIIYTVTVNDGESTASSTVTVTVTEPQTVICPIPRQFDAHNLGDDGRLGARLDWYAANYEYPLDRFEIYRSSGTPNFELVKRIVNTPSITYYQVVDNVSRPGYYVYRIKAYYQNDCWSNYAEADVEIYNEDAVDENSVENVAVYPNPSSGMVNIKAEMMKKVTVCNVIGQIVLMQDVDNDEVVIDMRSFENGTYIISVMTEDGVVVRSVNVLK